MLFLYAISVCNPLSQLVDKQCCHYLYFYYLFKSVPIRVIRVCILRFNEINDRGLDWEIETRIWRIKADLADVVFIRNISLQSIKSIGR